MNKEKTIKKLAKKYIEINEKYEMNNYDLVDAKLEGKLEVLEEIFEEFFDIKDFYIVNGHLMSYGKKVG